MEFEKLKLTDEWDKTFPKSDKVDHRKITFHNRYGIELAADLYKPKGTEGKLPAIAISGPFGAVKEQSSGLYAQTLAERGFLTIAFDPSYTGESGGYPRNIASPEINTEDFSAAVDYLLNSDEVVPEAVGILGICGFGGVALNTASSDPRIKAIVASTMYNLPEGSSKGYFNASDNAKSRNEMRAAIAAQRTADYKNGTYARTGGLPDHMDPDAPQFQKDYFDYYKTKRGYHERSVNSNGGWVISSMIPYVTAPMDYYIEEIDNPVMICHGDKAHSFYFSAQAYGNLKGQNENKEFVIVKDAVHTDLYDNMEKIPFDEIEKFFKKYLVSGDDSKAVKE